MWWLWLACTARGTDSGTAVGADSGTTPAETSACPVDAVGQAVGSLQDSDLIEASGLVASQARPGVLWSHNDSSGQPQLFAIGEQGQALARVLVEDADAGDWEDLAWGRWDDQDALFIGDIGDNGRSREDITIWVVPEPGELTATVSAEALVLTYPDGPHDAEALIIDPLTGDLVIVAKELAGIAGVFQRSAPLTDGPLEQVAAIDLASHPDVMLAQVTAADVSPDGRCVYLRTYTDVVAWERDPELPLANAFSGTTLVLAALGEAQGEALAADASGYWTVSEGKAAALNRFEEAP